MAPLLCTSVHSLQLLQQHLLLFELAEFDAHGHASSRSIAVQWLACVWVLSRCAAPTSTLNHFACLQVQLLVLRCPAADLEPQLLLSLQQRFPCIQQLHVADGSWGWTGCRSLQAWAGSLTDLQANDTSFPLVALLAHDQQLPQHNQQPPRALPPARNATGPHAQLQEVGAGSAQVRPHHSSATATTCRQHARGQTPQQLRQQQQRQQDAGSLVPAELQGLLHLQLQRTVTTVIKCQKHGSAECQCLVSMRLFSAARCQLGILLALTEPSMDSGPF